MAKFIVEGGHRLKGEIRPQGAKNEALQIICAALLTKERMVLHNVPIIADVMQLMELMSRMGHAAHVAHGCKGGAFVG